MPRACYGWCWYWYRQPLATPDDAITPHTPHSWCHYASHCRWYGQPLASCRLPAGYWLHYHMLCRLLPLLLLILILAFRHWYWLKLHIISLRHYYYTLLHWYHYYFQLHIAAIDTNILLLHTYYYDYCFRYYYAIVLFSFHITYYYKY